MPKSAEAQRIAEAVAEGMFARDHAAQGLGVTIVEMRPGYARLTMVVRQDMLNGHETLHGGFSFALADTAFAYACNSYNHVAVAAGCDIVYPAAGHLGDLLTAEAVEVHRAGRSGVYDVSVTTQNGEIVALFRGKSRVLQGEVVAGLTHHA